MNTCNLLRSLAVALIVASTACAQAQVTNPDTVAQHYSALVLATYEDILDAAFELRKANQEFVAAPSFEAHQAAKKAWIVAREKYGQSEAFRFYGGPIDDAKGPEGEINAWPVDEAYIDYVKGKPNSGLINNPKMVISKRNLKRLNERGGEENVSAGWHAIEFLLWGQDFKVDRAGDRSFEDYVDGKTPNADRRRQYLTAATELLIDDLRYLADAWAPGKNNYRQRFDKGGMESVRKIIVGLGSLARGELAGERMEVALDSQDQEDEHSCFSDNTHRDIVNNALGMENVWLGRYQRSDGHVLQGASLRDLVAVKDVALAERLTQRMTSSVTSAQAIQAPFDREIVGNNEAPGRRRIRTTIDSLVQQSKDLVDVATVLGITRLTLVKP